VAERIYLWKPGSGAPVKLSQGDDDFVFKLAFSPDGNILASVAKTSVLLWRVATGERIGSIPISAPAALDAIAFHPHQGNILAVAGTEVQLWNINTLKPLGPPLQDGSREHSLLAVAFSPDGGTIASAGTDHKVRLWSYPPSTDGRPFSTLTGHGRTVWNVAFDSARTLLSSGEAGEVIVWGLDRAAPLSNPLGIYPSTVLRVTADPTGHTLAIGDSAGGLTLRKVVPGATEAPLEHRHQKAIRSLALVEDGRLLASGDAAGKLFLWRDRQFLREINLTGERDPISSLALTPDGKRGAVGTRGGRIFLWDVAGMEPLTALQPAGDAVTALAFDPSSGNLVSAGGRKLTLWDTSRHMELGSEEKAHDTTIVNLAFRPSGSLLASGSLDGTVRLWSIGKALEAQGGELPIPLSNALAWSPDGTVLATGGIDGAISLLDMKERKLMGAGLPGAEHIVGLAFRDDGYLVSCSGKKITEWDLLYPRWISRACGIVNRNLSHAEWNKYMGRRKYRLICPS
jgi:WD40 repeat protein